MENSIISILGAQASFAEAESQDVAANTRGTFMWSDSSRC